VHPGAGRRGRSTFCLTDSRARRRRRTAAARRITTSTAGGGPLLSLSCDGDAIISEATELGNPLDSKLRHEDNSNGQISIKYELNSSLKR